MRQGNRGDGGVRKTASVMKGRGGGGMGVQENGVRGRQRGGREDYQRALCAAMGEKAEGKSCGCVGGWRQDE